MTELAQKKEPIVRADIAKADAMKMFGERNEEYKCELISELEDGHITTYTQVASPALMEEAKKRDHRKLGKEMELFAFSSNVGAGLPLWLPKGAALRDRLEQFLRKIQKQYGYLQVITPHIGNKMLYVTSGHDAK